MHIFPWFFCLLAYLRLSIVASDICDGEIDLVVILDGQGEVQESWWTQVIESLKDLGGRGPFSWDMYPYQVITRWIDFARPIPTESDTEGYFDPDYLTNAEEYSWDRNVETDNSLKEAFKTFTEELNRQSASKMIIMFTDGNFENASVSEEAASKLKTDLGVLFAVVGVGSFDRGQLEKIISSDFIFDGTSDEKLGVVNDDLDEILMAILCVREMPTFGAAGSGINDQSTSTEETPCPGPAGPTDAPPSTPGTTDSPLSTPGPTDAPLSTPGPTDAPLSTPEPTDSPLSTPGPTDGSTPSDTVPCGSPTPGL